MISRRLKAKWILPVDRPPIENGLIEIVDGVITAVRAADSHDAAADDLGDVAIIPGLVNAHIHLEFRVEPILLKLNTIKNHYIFKQVKA